ncbi:MAG: group 1 truncated hemoglobin [Myxococcota bacterium]
MTNSLYEKYGGSSTVVAIANDFYRRVMRSAALKGYFENVNMDRLIGHQVKFLSQVLGGPDTYSGRTLQRAHQGLKIDAQAFEEVARCLRDSLTEAGVENDDLQAILKIVASTRNDIISQTAAS